MAWTVGQSVSYGFYGQGYFGQGQAEEIRDNGAGGRAMQVLRRRQEWEDRIAARRQEEDELVLIMAMMEQE